MAGLGILLFIVYRGPIAEAPHKKTEQTKNLLSATSSQLHLYWDMFRVVISAVSSFLFIHKRKAKLVFPLTMQISHSDAVACPIITQKWFAPPESSSALPASHCSPLLFYGLLVV